MLNKLFMDLVFATNNKNKIKEVTPLIGNQYKILSLDEIGCLTELEETQSTLEGNALQKARCVFEHFKLSCFADDTGLEIDFLDGRPGVFSARYAGEGKKAEDNIQKILSEMKGCKERQARFRTVIALILEGKEFLFEGEVKGLITESKRGVTGFGYDPVFQPEGFTKTFAEMTLSEKNLISHRAKAVSKLVEFLF